MGALYEPKCELHVYASTGAGPLARKYEISGLHMDFEVDTFAGGGKGKSKPNTARISVYNLARTTRELFSEEHQGIEFYAGYGDDVGLIFSGQTTNVIHEQGPVDWRTDIYAGDGIKEFQRRFFLKSFSAGTPISQMLMDMCDSAQLPYTIDPYATGTVAGKVLLSGETYAGRLAYCLDDICGDYGLEWGIQYGALEIYVKDSPFTADPVAVVLSADTGLIGAPVLMDRTDEEPLETKKELATPPIRKFSVQMTSLMNYRIKPKRPVELRAQSAITEIGQLMTDPTQVARLDLSGIYTARQVSYRGNNYGGEFNTVVTADLHD